MLVLSCIYCFKVEWHRSVALKVTFEYESEREGFLYTSVNISPDGFDMNEK